MKTKEYFNTYIKRISSQPLFVNIASLGMVQIANYLIPVIIVPFVIRALGVEAFGKASYAQNIVAYLTILVNFGFDYSATQDVAINRDDKEKLRSVFWTVINFKVILLSVSFVVLGALYFTSHKVNEEPLLYFYAALINVGFVFFPNWFFQGMEKMAKMSLFNFAVKFIGALLVVLVVSSPADYCLYLLILSLTYALVGILAFFYVLRRFDLGAHRCSMEKKIITKSVPVFLNTIFASLYTMSGMTILGMYVSDIELGVYGGVYKIIMAFVVLASMPINVAIFPMMSREFEKSQASGFLLMRKMVRILFPVMLLYCACICWFSPLIVRVFLGEQAGNSVFYLRLFSLLPMLVVFASFLTVQCLYGLHLQKYAPWVGGIVGLLCVAANFWVIPIYGSIGAIAAYLGAEVLEMLLSGMFVFFYIKR